MMRAQHWVVLTWSRLTDLHMRGFAHCRITCILTLIPDAKVFNKQCLIYISADNNQMDARKLAAHANTINVGLAGVPRLQLQIVSCTIQGWSAACEQQWCAYGCMMERNVATNPNTYITGWSFKGVRELPTCNMLNYISRWYLPILPDIAHPHVNNDISHEIYSHPKIGA